MSFWRAACRTGTPVAAAFVSQYQYNFGTEEKVASRCDEGHHQHHHHQHHEAGMRPDEEDDFHGLFPKRQLFQPKVRYPLWDRNWDGREPSSTGDKDYDREKMRRIRKNGITRHVILIRHGQYDESYKEDEKRVLTPLGKIQADMTGLRISEMIHGHETSFRPCKVVALRVSDLTRAKETADIIARHLPNVKYADPDPLLNEGK